MIFTVLLDAYQSLNNANVPLKIITLFSQFKFFISVIQSCWTSFAYYRTFPAELGRPENLRFSSHKLTYINYRNNIIMNRIRTYIIVFQNIIYINYGRYIFILYWYNDIYNQTQTSTIEKIRDLSFFLIQCEFFIAYNLLSWKKSP